MTNSVPTLRSSVVVYQSRQCIVGSGGVLLLVDTPTKAQSLGLSAFDAIKTDILYAELAPGEQLRLRVLCDRYGCGASPIREALNQLASDGWVVRIDRRGFFVSPTSEEEFQDILTNRCFLEAEALRRAIALGDSTWEERVLLAHHRMNRVPRHGQREDNEVNRDWEAAHKAFRSAEHTSELQSLMRISY